MNNITILYVDDEPDALKSMKLGLEDRGYNVLTAETGNAALELLQTTTPDIVITDLRMHPMNGFDFFQEAKKLSQLAHTPFFFLTAVDDFLAQKYGKSLGVDAYLTKPINLSNLDVIIKQKVKTK